ncbi:beta-lactamase/transpeptidase-like protein [Lindgomyces ingoldianus]|uniref:Beta-lactamase/transpeptidase-like protein n=1 Tax=Lindgomyces ingoldianus TaxID=673940 RepID=A0ACB6Q6W6_9PLEO|nr:beta-lactamase/transpeptidase-like protein [Lindgomyces ingoldianus]KAF2462581.1 beta-lactamase/transpeptidase-like protein [Lindgomyces ingoldianus]
MSIGVLHRGQIIHTKHLGQRDISTGKAPQDDTLYHIASLTKVLTTCLIGILVAEGLLTWETPIREYLHTLRSRSDEMGVNATLCDVASNRTGLSSSDFFWGQQNGDILTPKNDLVSLSTVIQASKPFRRSFIYSPWNYILIQAVIETVTGKPFGQTMREKLFDPLGLHQTTLEGLEGSNIAYPHAVHDDGGVTRTPICPFSSDTGLTAVMGGKSTLREMLTIYSAILSAYAHQKENNVDTTPGLPFTYLRLIFEPHIQLRRNVPTSSQAYCLGVYRTILPGNLSCASLNASLLRRSAPTFGIDLPGTKIFHHTGNIPGYFHSMFLETETQSCVVCLSNATPFMDATDFSAQLLLGTLLGSRSFPSFLPLAKTAKQTQMAWYEHLSRYLCANKTERLPTLPFAAYSGRYSNAMGNFVLDIISMKAGLRVYVQSHSLTTYDLLPYDRDTFYWEANRNREVCDRAMFPVSDYHTRLVSFHLGARGVESLQWHCDPMVQPEVFRRKLQAESTRL